ncbi:ABC transporter substrate-binding protein [Streptosporangium saharense]|uniref:ABC transporter substrate-binding protein n=1 Tax=Streptosporangium saharense TaxID=1706840 RepID=UPI003330D959
MKVCGIQARVVAPAALLALLAAATGCGDNAPKTNERPTIRWGVATEGITSMDPVRAVQPVDRTLSMMLFDGLVRYQPGNATAPFEPGIAKEIPQPTTQDGKQVWTIALRAGVKCPAGQKTPAYDLTSDDVVFSLKRASNPDTSTFASVFTAYDTVEAVDAGTVKVTMKQPVSPAAFLPTISNWQGGLVVCKKAVEAEGEDFGKHPVGPGPFKFEKWTPGQRITLLANDDYYLGKPLSAGWDIRFMPDDTARQAALFGGDLDVAPPTATGDKGLEAIDSRKGFKVVEAPLFGTWYLLFNTKVGPTANPEVRKALAYAVNRADYVALTGKRTAKPTLSVWGAQLPGGIPDSHVEQAGLAYEFDVAKARQMLAAAGYPNGFDVTVTAPSNATTFQVLQAQMKEIGVNVKIKTVDVPTWQTAIMTGQEPLMLSLISYRPTPQIPYTDFFYGPSAVRGGKHPAQNFGGYDGADALIEKAAKTSDSAEQARLWQEINDKILADAAAKPLFVAYQAYGAVCGFTMGGVEPPTTIPGNWQPSYKATVDTRANDC